MTLLVSQHFFSKDFYLKKLLKSLNAIMLSRCCFIFSLRRGAILIAIIDMCVTAFFLLIIFLAIANAQEIEARVRSDMQQLIEKDFFEYTLKGSTKYVLSNENKMLMGQRLASFTMLFFWTFMILASVHFVSCVLFLYGAIRNCANFLLPWISTTLFSLISGAFFLVFLTIIPVLDGNFGALIAFTFFYSMELYAWLVALNHYRVLKSSHCNNFLSEKVLFTTQAV